jgi:hypothetical protein
MKEKLKNLFSSVIRVVNRILSSFMVLSRKILGIFYNLINLEQYHRTLLLVRKYYKKLFIPTIIISLFINAIYISISNYLFHSFHFIVVFFIFIFVFIIIILRGCLRGENIKEEYTGDN